MKPTPESATRRPRWTTHPSARFLTGRPAASLLLSLTLLASAVAAEEAAGLKTDQEQLSYALGMACGKHVHKQSIDLDHGAFLQGLGDARSGAKTLLTEAQAQSLVARLQEDLKKKRLVEQAEHLQAENDQAEQNRRDGEAFLTANKTKDGVVATPSGLQYVVLKAGEGQKPALDDLVVCHYRGMTIDGTEFDSTYQKGQPAIMPVKGVIKGWSEALQMMPIGSKWKLFVPPQLAYGARAAGKSFGPNSTLVFEVELLSIDNSQPPTASLNPAASPAVAASAR